MPETLTLINGSSKQHLSAADRGLTYGDGLFETLRVANKTPEYWDLHLDRLIAGCHRLKINIDADRLCSELHQDVTRLLAQSADGHSSLKLMVTRGIGPRGYGYSAEISPTRLCSLSKSTVVDKTLKEQGARLFKCQLTLSHQPLLAGVKHLNRLEQVMARSEWSSDYYEGLLTDVHGHVIEAVMSNVFIVKDDRLITPELNMAGVAGILRHRVMAWAESQNYSLSVEKISLDMFKTADHLFVCNSLSGVVPINFFDGKNYLIWPLHGIMNEWLANDATESRTAFTLGFN